MATKRVKAGVYCRISSDPSGRKAGVQRQEEDCRALCEQLGWDIVDVYVDNDVSAYSGKPRPSYERLLNDLEAGLIGGVVCWHPDRLHRSPKELERFIDVIEASHARVASVMAGEYDLSTASGRMSARIVGAVARHESEQKSERIRRKVTQLASEGRALGGPPGFGYATKYTLDDTEAALLGDAATRVLAGESLRSLVAEWNHAGLRTKRGHAWSRTALRHILRSPRIAGLQQHRGVTVEAAWPAIIDRTTHERLVSLLDHPTRQGRPRSDARLLSGMLLCGACQPGRSVLWVVALSGSTRPHHGYSCRRCYGVTVSVDRVEEHVERELLAELAAHAVRPASADSAPHVAELEAIAELRARWARRAGAGEISETEWDTARSELDRREQTARAALASIDTDLSASDLDGLAERWTGLPLDAKRMFLDRVAETIVVHPAGGSVWNPDRIKITWR